jgi:hypothetical protein
MLQLDRGRFIIRENRNKLVSVKFAKPRNPKIGEAGALVVSDRFDEAGTLEGFHAIASLESICPSIRSFATSFHIECF